MIGLIANIVMFLVWAYAMYRWIKAEKKAQNNRDTMIKVWNENTRLNKQLSRYQKNELNFDPTKWLDKHKEEVSD